MQIDIAESIRETLAEHQAISLYGIGTLALNHIPASFGKQRQSLLPPTMKLNFSETNTSNTPLIDWLIKKYDISASDAEKAFKTFCERMLNAIVNYGKVNLKGVAYFHKDENAVLKCTPDKDFLKLFYKGLPEVPISLVKTSKATTKSPKTTSDAEVVSSITTDLEPDTSKSIPAVDNSKSEAVSTKFEKQADLKAKSIVQDVEPESILKQDLDRGLNVSAQPPSSVAPKAIPVVQDNTNLKSTYDENAKWDPSPVKDGYESDSIFNGRNIALLLGLLLLLILGYFGCQKFLGSDNDNGSNEDPIVSDNLLPSHVDTLSNGLVDSSTLINTEVPLPERCIIITGAFEKSRNVIRMQDLLISQGYDVYKAVEGGLTRVGFRFDCQNEDLEDYLQNIRRNISKKLGI